MKRPSPSLVVSVLALVVATGGTSYAAATIGTNDIQNQAVTSAKIKTGNLVSHDILDGTIREQDLSPSVQAGLGSDSRWVLVNAAGQIEAASDDDFEIVAAYPADPAAANGNVYIDAGEDLSNNGFVATIALQNTSDQNADGISNGTAPNADANPEFSGEIAVSRCNVGAPTTPPTPPTACAPEGARNANSFVVSPRNSDGTRTTADTRKRFYVILAGDSSDRVN